MVGPAGSAGGVVAAGGYSVRGSGDYSRRSFDRRDGHDLGERFVVKLLPAVRLVIPACLVGLVSLIRPTGPDRPLPEPTAPARTRHQAVRFANQARNAVFLSADARPGSTDRAVVYALGTDEPVVAGDQAHLHSVGNYLK